jgi:hypothetical protein
VATFDDPLDETICSMLVELWMKSMPGSVSILLLISLGGRRFLLWVLQAILISAA